MTQVAVSGAGVIDLVLYLATADAPVEIWAEIKVDAPESGVQIDNYREFIASRGSAPPQLITIGKAPVRPDPHLPWISWQSIREHARRSSQPYWADFAAYLEEIRMADEFDAPITSREAASLSDAVRLLGKTRRLLWPVLEQASSRWPDSPWPKNEEELRRNLAVWYRDRGRYAAEMGDYSRVGAWLAVGVWPGEVETELGLSVITEPKVLQVRQALLALADENNLPVDWERHVAGWEGLRVRERLVAFRDHRDAGEWLLARLAELSEAEVLGVIGQPLVGAPPESGRLRVDKRA